MNEPNNPRASSPQLDVRADAVKTIANLAALLATACVEDVAGTGRVETECLNGAAVVHVDDGAVDVVLRPGAGSSRDGVLTVHVRRATASDVAR